MPSATVHGFPEATDTGQSPGNVAVEDDVAAHWLVRAYCCHAAGEGYAWAGNREPAVDLR